MSRYVVDASVALKWYLPEVHSADAMRYCDPAHSLATVDLLFVEVANALWKREGRGDIDARESDRIAAAIAGVPFQVHASRPLLPAAVAISRHVRRTVYDSLYLALAIERGCPVVTADERLFNALNSSPLRSSLRWVATPP